MTKKEAEENMEKVSLDCLKDYQKLVESASNAVDRELEWCIEGMYQQAKRYIAAYEADKENKKRQENIEEAIEYKEKRQDHF